MARLCLGTIRPSYLVFPPECGGADSSFARRPHESDSDGVGDSVQGSSLRRLQRLHPSTRQRHVQRRGYEIGQTETVGAAAAAAAGCVMV